MKAEDVKRLKDHGPLNFEQIKLFESNENNEGLKDSIYYNESLDGFVKVMPFRKHAIRFPEPK